MNLAKLPSQNEPYSFYRGKSGKPVLCSLLYRLIPINVSKKDLMTVLSLLYLVYPLSGLMGFASLKNNYVYLDIVCQSKMTFLLLLFCKNFIMLFFCLVREILTNTPTPKTANHHNGGLPVWSLCCCCGMCWSAPRDACEVCLSPDLL